MRWRTLAGVLIFTQLSAQVLPQFGEERVGISTAAALKFLGSARSAALVGAALAVPDAAASWLNPALAAEQKGTYAVALVSQRFMAELWYHAACVGYRLAEPATLVLSAATLSVPPIEETTELRPYGTGRHFRFGHWNVGVTYAHRLTEQFAAGITLRYVQERWAEATLRGLVWDAGTLYWTGIGSLRLAVAISHFGFPLRAVGTVPTIRLPASAVQQRQDFQSFAPPTLFRIGAAAEVLQTEAQRWTWAVAVEHPSDEAESYAVASEYGIRFSAAFPAELSFRAGIRANAPEWWAAGVGVALPLTTVVLRIDYALSAREPVGLVWRLGCVLEPLRVP